MPANTSSHGHDVGPASAERRDVVLLIHGLAGSSRTWDAVMPALAERYDVIAPDLLGHGESAKPMGDYSLGAFASGLRDFLAVLDVDERHDRGPLVRRRGGDAARVPTPATSSTGWCSSAVADSAGR